MRQDFEQAVNEIVAEDPRFDNEAYDFVRQALDHTVKMLKKPTGKGPQRHVSGRELLEGICAYAIQEFGPVAKLVLNTWGLTQTADFGEIVFNLVNKGVLGKTEADKKEDFSDVYDFEQAFVKPYLPPSRRSKAGASSRSRRKQRTPVPEDPQK